MKPLVIVEPYFRYLIVALIDPLKGTLFELLRPLPKLCRARSHASQPQGEGALGHGGRDHLHKAPPDGGKGLGVFGFGV